MVRYRAESFRGRLVAEALSGAWRAAPPALELSAAELALIAPLLLESGGAALAWRRVRDSDLGETPAAAELRQAYRLHALQAALHERNIERALALLRARGVDPLLVKGWACARLYPEPGARPYGDIDLCVRPEDYAKAQEVLRTTGGKYPVDLHRGARLLDYHAFDELFSRSRLVALGDAHVRIPSAEDHLRIICFHTLRHGAERPIALCDIAVAVESRPPDFDWGLCFGPGRKRADWIACAIGLACLLLGARADGTPVAARAASLPGWLVKSVLDSWAKPFSGHFSRQDSMSVSLRRPRSLARALAGRWPDPVSGTVGVGGSFNGWPRFPYQLAYLLTRSARFLGSGLRAAAAD